MSNAKHTPGPWQAEVNTALSRLWIITRKDTGLKIATSDANARLIALAPELAGELAAITEQIDVWLDHGDAAADPPDTTEARALLERLEP